MSCELQTADFQLGKSHPHPSLSTLRSPVSHHGAFPSPSGVRAAASIPLEDHQEHLQTLPEKSNDWIPCPQNKNTHKAESTHGCNQGVMFIQAA